MKKRRHKEYRIENKLENKCFSKLTTEEGRNPYFGVNGILTHYNIRYDPYIGLVKLTTIIFTEHCKEILTEYSLISGKFGY